MKHFLLKAGRFLRLIDEASPMLSITNICMYVIIAKIAMAAEFSMADIGGLFVGLLSYSSKKIINNKQANVEQAQSLDVNPQMEKLKSDVQDLKDKVGAASLAAGIKRG